MTQLDQPSRRRRPIVGAVLSLAVLATLVLAGQGQAAPPGPDDANLGLVIRGAPLRVEVGEQVTYFATIRNHGPALATGVTFTDRLPNGMTLVSVSSSQGSCGGSEPITCALGTLAAGSSATVQIDATATAAGRRVDVGRVDGDQGDPRRINNRASAITIVEGGAGHSADLGLVIRGAPFRADIGQRVIYVAHIRNNGPLGATGVVFSNRLPNGMALVSVASSQGACIVAPIRCHLGALANGQEATVTIVARALVPGRRVDTGRVDGNEPDPRRVNNHASAVTLVHR